MSTENKLREWAKVCEGVGGLNRCEVLINAANELAKKDAEIAELRKDAERYRWIRDRLGMDISVLSAQGEYQRKWLGGSLLDDVIDAKRSKPSE